MAAALMESALDLSAKAGSPVPSNASDVESRFDRASSVSSDSEPEDGPPVGFKVVSRLLPGGGEGRGIPRRTLTSPAHTALEPAGPNPRVSTPPSSSPPGFSADVSPTSSNGLSSPNGPVRPFKMYPFDPMPNMYSQLAAAASQSMYQYGPTSPTSAMSMHGLFDGGISLSSPIGQYLHHKKRRLETRDPPAPSSGNTSPASSTDEPYLIGPNGKKIIPVPDEKKDGAYWERRRKNNEAAKRSRDARRAKEEEIALRAAFLEQENLKLRAQVAILKNETAKLHYMLYNRM